MTPCVWITYNTSVQYIQHTSPVHTTHQSSTFNIPVQYIQHTSPVHTTHQSSTFNISVQYIQHTSPVHSTYQSSTYNSTCNTSTFKNSYAPVRHTSPVHTTHQSSTCKIPVQLNMPVQYNTPNQYIHHTTSPVFTACTNITRSLVCPSCAFPLANLPCVHVLKSGYSILVFLLNNILSYLLP